MRLPNPSTFLMLAAASKNSYDPNKPNIILYLGDDVGIGMVNQHAPDYALLEDAKYLRAIPKSRRIQTPTLERIAREGKRFFHSYAPSSICGPSRHSLMTGIQIGDVASRGNGFGSVDDSDGASDGKPSDTDIPRDSTTIAEALKVAGYSTYAVGKWGMTKSATSAGNPCERGFDEFFGVYTHQETGHAFPKSISHCRSLPSGGVDRDEVQYPQNKKSSKKECIGTGKCAYFDFEIRNKALSYLTNHVDSKPDKPFFLYWGTTAGHVAMYEQFDKNKRCNLMTHPVPSFGRYTEQALRNTGRTTPEIRGLMAMLELTVDEDIRILLDFVESKGLQNNTLLVFTSDNGAHDEAFADKDFNTSVDLVGTGGLSGSKRKMYEGGIRSPTIMWWPGVIPAGTTTNFFTAHYDLALTFAEVAGIPESHNILTSFKRKNAGGVSIWPVVVADSDKTISNAPNREWLYAEVCFKNGGPRTTRGKVCPIKPSLYRGCAFAYFDVNSWPNHVYKYVENTVRSKREIYDLMSDSFETKDLSGARAEMKLSLERARASVRFPLCPLEDAYDEACFTSPCNKLSSSLCIADTNCSWSPSTSPYSCIPVNTA